MAGANLSASEKSPPAVTVILAPTPLRLLVVPTVTTSSQWLGSLETFSKSLATPGEPSASPRLDHQQVCPAVIIEVSVGDSPTGGRIVGPGGRRDVREGAVAVVDKDGIRLMQHVEAGVVVHLPGHDVEVQ